MGVGRTQPVFELVTRHNCHLCEVMEELLNHELPLFGLDYRPIDVDSDPELRRRYSDVVPVLLRDGKPVAKLRLDRKRLHRLVTRRRLFNRTSGA